ncbi:MAG: hypothetical protein IJZ51_10500 [Ruminiclostridium sp.]|nr:hypothetical protein [Ruminiclostridium sp.]
MAKYYVNGKEYELSLFGLVINADTDDENVFILYPFDNNWDRYFSADAEWLASGNKRAVIVYANNSNLREVERLTYLYWKQVDDPNNTELEVEIGETDRAYLNGLLNQRLGIKHDEW